MIALALIGVGKIARDQHVPAIAAGREFTLVATASPDGGIANIPSYPDIASLLASGLRVEAAAICTPPDVRHALAREAIEAGLHVLLEKPPAATPGAVADLISRAETAKTTLFAAWHSRFAAGVEPARTWLATRAIKTVRIEWREDIRRWHPGQEWILDARGFGVFDPGINALSILTAILPEAVVLTDATMTVPEGRGAALSAALTMRSGATGIEADFDFLQEGPQTWSIECQTADGDLLLADGGKTLSIDSALIHTPSHGEYAALYHHFATLIAQRRSDVDMTPLELVIDAQTAGRRTIGLPFAF